MDILSKSEESRFVRTGRGLFFLRDLIGETDLQYDDTLSIVSQDKMKLEPYRARRRVPPFPDEKVLVIPKRVYSRFLRFQGVKKADNQYLERLLSDDSVKYLPRVEAENDDDHKQVVTYTLITCGSKVLSFERGQYNRVASFLRGSRCIGFGGHVTQADLTLFSPQDLGVVENALRELGEELGIRGTAIPSSTNQLKVIGVLNDDSSSVGRRHVSIILRYEVEDWDSWSKVRGGEVSINRLKWVDTLTDEVDLNQFEYWSQLCLREFFESVVAGQPTHKILRKKPFQSNHLMAVIGTIGSGKSSASKILKRRFGYQEINSGQLLAELIGIPPVPTTPRLNFQERANSFIKEANGPERLAVAIADAVRKFSSDRVLVDGIRHRDTLEALRKHLEMDVAVLYVQTAPDVAFGLYKNRESKPDKVLSLHAFMQMYSAPVEEDVRYMISDADAIIFNWSGIEKFDLALEDLALKLGIRPT